MHMLASCQCDPSGQFDPHGESEFSLMTSIGMSEIRDASVRVHKDKMRKKQDLTVIFLPAHPASFAHNFVSGMQSFYFTESQDVIVLQICH